MMQKYCDQVGPAYLGGQNVWFFFFFCIGRNFADFISKKIQTWKGVSFVDDSSKAISGLCSAELSCTAPVISVFGGNLALPPRLFKGNLRRAILEIYAVFSQLVSN